MDAAREQMLWGLEQADVVKISDEEVEFLFGIAPELGGEYITIGSDAHFTEHVGAGINEGFAIAEAAGFEYVTYFEKHKPTLVRIEK